MIPQRLAPFRRGQRLEFVGLVDARWSGLGLVGLDSFPRALARNWTVSSSPAPVRYLGTNGGGLLGTAISPDADGLVLVHRHPEGARLFTQRGGELVGERIYPSAHWPSPVATNGRCIASVRQPSASLWRFDDWTLAREQPWPLELVRERLGDLGEYGLKVRALRDLRDTLLVQTVGSFSRWTWDATLLDAWRAPTRDHYFVAWRDPAPILHINAIDPDTGQRLYGRGSFELATWDPTTGQTRSLGPVFDWPRGGCSADGRWFVVDRVSRAGRGLELWDLAAHELVERLDTRRRRVTVIEFRGDSLELAVAAPELFAMRVVA